MVIQADLEPRPLRADARRNRDRLLAVAREAFAEQGGDAALDEIARCAGVGIGTLYRHFPTRQDLMEAAFLDQAQELQAKAVALAADPDPFTALVTWLRAHVVAGARGRSLASTVMCAKHQQGSPINVACTQMAAAGAALLVRAQAAGQVRPDVQSSDVFRMVHGIVLANEQSDDPARADRMLDLVVAGLRPAASP